MGTAASSNKNTSVGNSVISPRVQISKKGAKDAVLDSSSLSDVGSGTIHYRYKIPEISVNADPLMDRNDIRTGYFYHPKLQDYSEFGDPIKEETFKFIRVSEGPKRMQNNQVFYVSGIGFDGSQEHMPSSLIAMGPGVAQSKKRIYGHKYYLVSLTANGDEDTAILHNGLVENEDGALRLKENRDFTVKDVKGKLGLYLLCPMAILHLENTQNDELRDDQKLHEIFPAKQDDEITVLLTAF